MDVYVVDGFRTPFGRKNGMLKEVSHHKLAATLLSEMKRRYGESEIVILGNLVGGGGNVARYSLLEAEWNQSVPGTTLDVQCGSGLEAVRLACALMKCGMNHYVIAGGTESSTHSYLQKRASFAPNDIGDPEMLEAAENVAKKWNITREVQDRWAVRSYEKTLEAMQSDKLTAEILPYKEMTIDEQIVKVSNYKKLIEKAPFVWKKGGTVTLGNSCGENDGAAIVALMNGEEAKKRGIKEGIRYVESEIVGINPNYPAVGSVVAVKNLLEKMNLQVEDIDRWECNEAFAVKIAVLQETLQIPVERMNCNGGALSIGHPFSASGATLVMRLLHELKRTKKRYGVSAIGIAGGMGLAVLWERCEIK